MKRSQGFFLHLHVQDGVSLLEVLIAMVIVFMTLLGFAGFSVVAHTGMVASQNMTRAVTLAQEKIENIRRDGLQSALTHVLTETEPYDSIHGAPQLQRILTITPNKPISGLHAVTVTMQWDQGAHSTSLATYLPE